MRDPYSQQGRAKRDISKVSQPLSNYLSANSLISQSNFVTLRRQLGPADPPSKPKKAREVSKGSNSSASKHLSRGRKDCKENVGLWDEYGSSFDQTNARFSRSKPRKSVSKESSLRSSKINPPVAIKTTLRAENDSKWRFYYGANANQSRELSKTGSNSSHLSSKPPAKADRPRKGSAKKSPEHVRKSSGLTHVSSTLSKQSLMSNDARQAVKSPFLKLRSSEPSKPEHRSGKKSSEVKETAQTGSCLVAKLKSNVPTKKKSTKKLEAKNAIIIQRWWRRKMAVIRKRRAKLVPISTPALPHPPKDNNLKAVLDKCKELSKVQSQQWQELLGFIHQMDISSGKVSLVKRIQQETTRAITHLNRFNAIKPISNLNRSCSMTSFSMERKAIEKWLQPDESVVEKNGYELLHGSVFGSDKPSKALIVPKKMNILAKKIDSNESVGLLRMLKIDPAKRAAQASSLQLVQSFNRESISPNVTEQSSKQQQNELIAEVILHDMLDQSVNAHAISKNKNTNCSISEEQLHLLLNDLSELLLFTRLPTLRVYLSIPRNLSFPFEALTPQPLFSDEKAVVLSEVCSVNSATLHPLLFLFSQGLSEALNSLRPHHKPLALLHPPFPLPSEPITVNQLETACNILLNWTDYMVGFLLSGDNCFVERIREERMSKMIEREVVEREMEWAALGGFEFEVGRDLDHWIFEQVLTSVLQEFI